MLFLTMADTQITKGMFNQAVAKIDESTVVKIVVQGNGGSSVKSMFDIEWWTEQNDFKKKYHTERRRAWRDDYHNVDTFGGFVYTISLRKEVK